MSRLVPTALGGGSRRDCTPEPARHRQPGDWPFRAIGAVQTAWGVTLLAAGPQVWRHLDERGPSDTDRLALKVLGSRHVVTGLAQVALPTHFQRSGIAVDLLHLSSMCALAAVDPPRRRPALATAGSALANALTVWSLRRRFSDSA